jgi:hypothetical protein
VAVPNWKDKRDIPFIAAEFEGFVVHAINKIVKSVKF